MRRQAATEHRSARLSEPFGLEYATRLFGAETIASLPLLKAGPNRGKPRGTLNWLRTTEAGYHVNAGGGVAAGVTVRAWIADSAAPESCAVTGLWMGRQQTICGSACMLGPEAREREARERGRA